MPETRSDEERKMIIEKVNHLYETSDLTIKEACSEFGISDSAYYIWKKHRNLEPETEKEETSNQDRENTSGDVDTETVKKVTELKEDKPFLGFKKISKQLAYSHGIKISTRQVKKILKEHGLEETDYPEPKDHPSRRFERNSSDEMWMMDIMHYTIEKEGRFYLISILDDYSRYIIAHGIFKRKTIDNVIDVLHEAFEESGLPGEFLTDRGSQFHSWKGESRFQKLLDKLGVKHILASPQSPQTIGKIESFHRNIQRELFGQKHFTSMEDVKKAVSDYIEYYNHERVHMGIDYLTPADRYYGVKQDAEKTYDV
ncbi:IS3 family transposase, partial [Halarsenatibacter silvermanii]